MEFHYYRKQLLFQRLAGSPKLRSYNLAEHAYFVTLLYMDLCKDEGKEITPDMIEAALKHDFLEVLTCDLPYHVKNLNAKTQEAWALIESEAVKAFSEARNEIGEDLGIPEVQKWADIELARTFRDTYELFKLADLLELWIFCKEEQELGNNSKQISKVVETCAKILSPDVRDPYFRSRKNFAHPKVEQIMREYRDQRDSD